ncbi:hypothetical protein D3C87_1212660 [compost metagenome]
MRQPVSSISVAVSQGASAGRPVVPITKPISRRGRSAGVAISWISTRDAENNPPAPSPCTASAADSSATLDDAAPSRQPTKAMARPSSV